MCNVIFDYIFFCFLIYGINGQWYNTCETCQEIFTPTHKKKCHEEFQNDNSLIL